MDPIDHLEQITKQEFKSVLRNVNKCEIMLQQL